MGDHRPPPALTPLARSNPPNEAMALAQRQALFRTLAAEDKPLGLWWLQRMAATTNPLSEKITW